MNDCSACCVTSTHLPGCSCDCHGRIKIALTAREIERMGLLKREYAVKRAAQSGVASRGARYRA